MLMMRKHKKIGLLIGSLLIVAGIAYLFYGGIGSNLVFFLTPAELKAKGAQAYEVPIRLGGQVVPGTVQWNAAALDLRFEMTDGKERVPVHARKAPPQMFREGMGVVVEGSLTRSGVFESSNLMVKHSNEYQPPEHGAKPQEVYKSLIKDKAGQ